MKISICGDSWSVLFHTQERFERENGSGTAACTDGNSLTIHLSPKANTVSIIRHELMHAYLNYAFLGSVTLEPHSYEELFVERLEYYWDEINELAHKIFKMGEKKYGK